MHSWLVHREPLAWVKMTLMMRMERTSGLLLLATPIPCQWTDTAGATLLKPATPAVLDSLMISYQLACTTAAMGYLIIHQCIWCPLQRTSKYPTFNDTRSAGKQASVLVMWCGRMLQIHKPVFVSYLNCTVRLLSCLRECSVCASYPLTSPVCFPLGLPLSGLDTAQHTYGTWDDITAAHLRVAPSFLNQSR